MSVEIKKILKGYKNKGNLGQSKQVFNLLKIQLGLTSQCTCTQKIFWNAEIKFDYTNLHILLK